jgi:hypothetical protein
MALTTPSLRGYRRSTLRRMNHSVAPNRVVSENSITTECAELQSVGGGRFLIVLHDFGRSDSIDERDEADGGGISRQDQSAARGRD